MLPDAGPAAGGGRRPRRVVASPPSPQIFFKPVDGGKIASVTFFDANAPERYCENQSREQSANGELGGGSSRVPETVG